MCSNTPSGHYFKILFLLLISYLVSLGHKLVFLFVYNNDCKCEEYVFNTTTLINEVISSSPKFWWF